MTHGHYQPARIKAAAEPRGRGRPEANHATGLRQRAWWLMRKLPRFTLDDLLFTLADGSERDAADNLRKYVRSLERVGVVARLMRRAPGNVPKSNGRVIWRLVRDVGRQAPVWRGVRGVVFDPNSGAELAPIDGAGEGEA